MGSRGWSWAGGWEGRAGWAVGEGPQGGVAPCGGCREGSEGRAAGEGPSMKGQKRPRPSSLGALASPAGCRRHSLRGCVSEPELAPGQEIRVSAAQPPTQGPPQHPDQLPGGPGQGGRKGGQRCPQGLASLKPQALPSPAWEASTAPQGSQCPSQPPNPVSLNSSLRPRLISRPGPSLLHCTRQPPTPREPPAGTFPPQWVGTRRLLPEARPIPHGGF